MTAINVAPRSSDTAGAEPDTEAPVHASAWRGGAGRARSVARWLLVAAALFATFLFRPTSLGGTYTFTVVSGDSMEPTFSHADLVVVSARDQYQVGDVVVYGIPDGPGAGRNVVHRLVGRDADGWLTRGDNRDTLDPWRPVDADIVGAQVAVVPSAGRWLVAAGSVWVLAGAAGVLVAMSLWRPSRAGA